MHNVASSNIYILLTNKCWKTWKNHLPEAHSIEIWQLQSNSECVQSFGELKSGGIPKVEEYDTIQSLLRLKNKS